MKISDLYNLQKSQAQLDFVDINITEDIPLFIDPFFLSKRNDNWSIESTQTIRSFFQEVINAINQGRDEDARDLFSYLHEPNATCLGMSQGNPRGRGVGLGDSENIYESLLNSKAIQTGLIQDIEDNILFIDNFGKDKLSDMATNIITRHLIEYTQNQCVLHNVELTPNIASGYFWDRTTLEWQITYTDMLVADGKKILLVPKGVVSFSKNYTPERYYNHFVLNFLQNDHIRMGGAFVQFKKDGTPFVTKKDLKEHNPQSKEFLRRFTRDHPEILDQFKEELGADSLSNLEITDFNIANVLHDMIENLRDLPSGHESASTYHNLVLGILEVIFYPHLIYPVKEREIHEGRKRIDITFDNASKVGIFNRLQENMHIPCRYFFIECKNYSRDIANPELDQISGRFSFNRGQVGFVVCRTIDDFPLFINRCRDTFRDGRGLIIPLVDSDLIQLLENHNNWNSIFQERFFSDRIREITID
jgi:hypothetical protein